MGIDRRLSGLLAVFCVVALACGDDGGMGDDAGTAMDGATTDSGQDAGAEDPDTGTGQPDGAMQDAGRAGCTEGCEIEQLALGFGHSCARRANGDVLCWGGNDDGQLGDGRMRHSGGGCALAGEVDPEDCTAEPVQVVDLAGSSSISARGGDSTCALDDAGDVYCWGRDTLEDMQVERYFRPEKIDGLSSAMTSAISNATSVMCILLDSGSAKCRGDNEVGQLGVGDAMEYTSVQDVTELSDAQSIRVATNVRQGFSSYGDFVCARTGSGVVCWGSDEFGQLGDGDTELGTCGNEVDARACSTTPVTVAGLDGTVQQIAVGGQHACALLEDGSLSCWGQNQAGQLARSTDQQSYVEPTDVPDVTNVSQVVAGGFFTCARLDSGDVQCWGANDRGQLGDGSLDHGTMCGIGGEQGDCSPDPVDVSLPSSAVHLAAGSAHACAVLEDGTVHCWGRNDLRQVGVEDRAPKPSPQQVTGIDG